MKIEFILYVNKIFDFYSILMNTMYEIHESEDGQRFYGKKAKTRQLIRKVRLETKMLSENTLNSILRFIIMPIKIEPFHSIYITYEFIQVIWIFIALFIIPLKVCEYFE